MNHNTLVIEIKSTLDKLIAAHYETSWSCVEKNIRNTVNAIWTSENRTILETIFNKTYTDRKPTNKEFFEYLYDFIFLSQENISTQSEEITSSILCPVCNNKCQVVESMISFVAKRLQPEPDCTHV